MDRVLLISDDSEFTRSFCNGSMGHLRLSRVMGHSDDKTLESEILKADFIIVDTQVLPSPDSQEINRFHKMFEHKVVIAVCGPMHSLVLSDIRAFFIAGASVLIEKPVDRTKLMELLTDNSLSQNTHAEGLYA